MKRRPEGSQRHLLRKVGVPVVEGRALGRMTVLPLSVVPNQEIGARRLLNLLMPFRSVVNTLKADLCSTLRQDSWLGIPRCASSSWLSAGSGTSTRYQGSVRHSQTLAAKHFSAP